MYIQRDIFQRNPRCYASWQADKGQVRSDVTIKHMEDLMYRKDPDALDRSPCVGLIYGDIRRDHATSGLQQRDRKWHAMNQGLHSTPGLQQRDRKWHAMNQRLHCTPGLQQRDRKWHAMNQGLHSTPGLQQRDRKWHAVNQRLHSFHSWLGNGFIKWFQMCIITYIIHMVQCNTCHPRATI